MIENFVVADLVRIILAFLLLTPLTVAPGALIALSCNIAEIRTAPLILRFAVSVVLSMGVVPILAFLGLRYLGAPNTVIAYVVLLILLCIPAIKQLPLVHRGSQFNSYLIPMGAVFAVWSLVALSMLVDVQIRDALFPPFAFYDYSKHIAVTDAITRTGVPPNNPYFFPGHPVKLFYYYYWFVLCSLCDFVGTEVVDPHAAVIGGTIWAGIGVMCTMVVSARAFSSTSTAYLRTAFISCVLLAVSGLDGILAGLVNLMTAIAHRPSVCPSVDWWNTDQITGWTSSLLWVPHHMASLAAFVAGSLVLRAVQYGTWRAPNIVAVALSALCFASGLGLSVYLGLTFGISWFVWVVLSAIAGGRLRQTIPWVIAAGLLAVMLSVPFIAVLKSANMSNNSQIAFGIRQFSPLDIFLPSSLHGMVNFLMLPITYFVEFGFFIIAAWLFQTRASRDSRYRDVFLYVVLAISFCISAFLRSTVHQNDLGSRSAVAMQWVLLLWSAQLLSHGGMRAAGIVRTWRRPLVALLFIGIATTVYDLYLLRTYSIFYADGHRAYYLRQVYQRMKQLVPADGVVQFNPQQPERPFFGLEPTFGFYGNRQLAAADRVYGTMFGIDSRDFDPVYRQIWDVFNGASEQQIRQTLQNCKVDAVIITNTDPVWNQPGSWFAGQVPATENAYARLYLLNRQH